MNYWNKENYTSDETYDNDELTYMTAATLCNNLASQSTDQSMRRFWLKRANLYVKALVGYKIRNNHKK